MRALTSLTLSAILFSIRWLMTARDTAHPRGSRSGALQPISIFSAISSRHREGAEGETAGDALRHGHESDVKVVARWPGRHGLVRRKPALDLVKDQVDAVLGAEGGEVGEVLGGTMIPLHPGSAPRSPRRRRLEPRVVSPRCRRRARRGSKHEGLVPCHDGRPVLSPTRC